MAVVTPLELTVVLYKGTIPIIAQRVAAALTAYHGGTVLPHAGAFFNMLTVAELVERELLIAWSETGDEK